MERTSSEKLEASNRRQRRKLVQNASASSISRFPSRVRTGTTTHFAMWMADLQMKKSLQRLKISKLADRAPDPQVKAAYGLAVKHGLKSVWDLVVATKSQMLDVPGMGPVRLRALSADLASHNVQVKW